MNLAELLLKIDDLKAEIDVLRPIPPEQERRILQKFRLDWTYHSNAIEGNTLTYGETRAFLLHGVTAQGKPFRDYLDMEGHHSAIDELLEIIQQKTPLTEAIIRELHKVILGKPYEIIAVTPDGLPTKKRIVPGQYKTTANHVETSTGELRFYASPEETPAKMAESVAWYRQHIEDNDLHPLILAATFHYQFVDIHPFDDGNGRMARILMNHVLMQAGFPPTIIPLKTKNEYLLALEQADADDNLEPFIQFIGQALLQSLDLFLRGAKGESIEEPKDIDKKVSILSTRVKNIENLNQQRKLNFEENSQNLVTNFIAPFLKGLNPKLMKFKSLFEDFDYKSFDTHFERDFSNEKDEILIEHVSKFIGKLSPLKIAYSWRKFIGDHDFNIFLHIKFIANKDEFIVEYLLSSREGQELVKGNYSSNYSQDIINDAIQELVDELHNIIEKKVSDLESQQTRSDNN